MKRILITILLTIAALSVAFGQTNNKPSTRNAKVAEQIKQMDKGWLIEAYYPTYDMSAFDRIAADDFIITHSKGKTFNKAQKRADIISHRFPSSMLPAESVYKIEDSSHQVRVYKNVAISIGYIVEKYQYQGKQVSNRIYFTNTYLKRNGSWQVVASQLTFVPQSQ
jgi:hypothetical protein